MPRSSTARFTEAWQKSVGDEGFLEGIVDRWRNSSLAADGQNLAMLAETMNLGPEQAVPATADDPRSARPREVANIRREPQVAAPANGTTLRSIRERLQQQR
jgi:hypothetical protein